MSPAERFRHYAEKPERLVVGLMSGTSVDGIDAALVAVSGSGRATTARLLHFVMQPFSPGLRFQILELAQGKGNPAQVAEIHTVLGIVFANTVSVLLNQAGVKYDELDLIASHGQTISHQPRGATPSVAGERLRLEPPIPSTFQIGETSALAQRFGAPVVSDFRVADMTAGGQGAPLVPYADWCLLTHPTKTRAIQNIGGIGNVTYLPANAAPEEVRGFDTGPGNMLIDRAVMHETEGKETFDRDGKYARQGAIAPDFLARLLDDPFLLKLPPKSAGREQFGEAFFHRLLAAPENTPLFFRHGPPYTGITTLTAFTAYSIADAYDRFLPIPPDEVIVGGGGAQNPILMQFLRERLAPTTVRTHEDIGMNSDAKEAISFAVLANETMLGNAANLPGVTGASRPVTLGKITLP